MVPRERIGVVKSEKNRKVLEKMLNVKLHVSENFVEISGDSLELYTAKNVIKAIGRGFSPEVALKLKNEDNYLEIIDLKGYTDNRIKVLRSRIIGTGGRMRETIERSTGANVSVYGKTVSLIGTYNQIRNAKKAVEMILSGAMHSTVYRYLKKIKLE